MRILGTAAAMIAILLLPLEATSASELVADAPAKIDQAVTSTLSSLYGGTSTIIAHVDLTKPFDTKSQWTLVVGKQPDEESTAQDGVGEPKGAISVCFVKNAVPDCSEAMFLAKYREQNITPPPEERPFYTLLASDIVYSGPHNTLPLLMLKTCTMDGANGNCGITTFLFTYDREPDRFRTVFFNITGRNNNQATRFVESGPLLGDVIVANPTGDAPFAYYVEVYKRNGNGSYARVLRYRSRTGYGDGNHLAVVDAEMPEILRRLGLWKRGDPLSVPPTMPAACTRLVMRNGVEWCE